MPFPAKAKTWTVTGNNAIAGASLNLMMGAYLFRVAVTFLLANGYTCKGSSTGVVAAMDGVNRWATAADALIRAANTTTANSWIVLTDGNGCNICLSYVGATDDVCRISYSPGGLYVAAGTATFTPTATDEIVLSTGVTVIDTTAAATNRTYFGWVDSQAKLCRNLLSLNSTGSPTGMVWGVELFDSSLQDRTISPSVWGFACGAANFACGGTVSTAMTSGVYAANSRGGSARVNVSQLNMSGGFPLWNNGNFTWFDVNTELQGTNGYPIWGPFRVGSMTASYTGVVAQLYDWWSCRNAAAAATCNLGDTLDTKNFMVVGILGGIMWPWDGSTTPANGARASVNQLGTTAGSQNPDPPAYGTFMDGFSAYVPLANNVVTPTAITSAPQSIERRAGVQVIELTAMPNDPTVDPKAGQLYWKTVGGLQTIFMEYPNGTIYTLGAG